MNENTSEPDDSKKYTEKDMLFAFRHGRDFEQIPMKLGADLPTDTKDINLPFWEWLKRHYEN